MPDTYDVTVTVTLRKSDGNVVSNTTERRGVPPEDFHVYWDRPLEPVYEGCRVVAYRQVGPVKFRLELLDRENDGKVLG